jgi:hypothetical protein
MDFPETGDASKPGQFCWPTFSQARSRGDSRTAQKIRTTVCFSPWSGFSSASKPVANVGRRNCAPKLAQ